MQTSLAALLICLLAIVSPTGDPDARSFQHGLDVLERPDGSHLAIWSSSGHPPSGEDANGNWTHDVYWAEYSSSGILGPTHTLLSNPEAQEPASSAISSDGHIFVTMEDGWQASNVLAQRFGVYDSNLQPILAYPQDVLDGGHSGHVAATHDRFVVFFSEGWVNGGGVDDLGSGDDVLATVFDTSGNRMHDVPVVVGSNTRDWWPLVAGGKQNALLVWQRFVDGETTSELMYAVLDSRSGTLIGAPQVLDDGLAYYTYSVEHVPSLQRFLVTGTYASGGGFAYLLSESGQVLTQRNDLPPSVREAWPILAPPPLRQGPWTVGPRSTRVALPIAPSGVQILKLEAASISTLGKLETHGAWNEIGLHGFFANHKHLNLMELTPAGVRLGTYRLRE